MSSGIAGFNWSIETLSILLFISVVKFLSSCCITYMTRVKGFWLRRGAKIYVKDDTGASPLEPRENLYNCN